MITNDYLLENRLLNKIKDKDNEIERLKHELEVTQEALNELLMGGDSPIE